MFVSFYNIVCDYKEIISSDYYTKFNIHYGMLDNTSKLSCRIVKAN